jgi:hypothetical protein
MDVREKQIAPPRNWALFESLFLALFKGLLKDPFAQKNGRTGQPQHGVDIMGKPAWSPQLFWGVQCKGKERAYGAKASLAELERELAKAESFSPPLAHWVFATTSPTDAALQQASREISQERQARGRFPISILSWDDIQVLLAENSLVLQEFYPEHAFDVPAILARLSALPTADELRQLTSNVQANSQKERADDETQPEGTTDAWLPVTFDDSRDLGPAIMGRPLGPADAASCPRLAEVDSLLHALRSAYSARLVGYPGAGKSVCAYQVALELVKDGWKVFRLRDPKIDDPEFTSSGVDARTLFLIDDAHLMLETRLKSAEERTNSSALLLSTHTISGEFANVRGAVTIDSRRAVRTIAAELRANLAETLRLVHIADSMVGEGAGDEPIERRLEDAENKADHPWQFCFILGGGWRRASSAADNARLASADIVLACAAIIQIASRDAKASRSVIFDCLRSANADVARIESSLAWLVAQRLLLASTDLRCPHQRFASVVLTRILRGQNEEGRRAIGRILESIVSNRSYPLAGLYSLVHEIRFGGSHHGEWIRLLPPESLQNLASRCWESSSPMERNLACLVATELDAYIPDWRSSVLRSQVPLLAAWISDPATPSGFGLGRLLNHLRNVDSDLLHAVISATSPSSVAAAVSSMTVEGTYSLAEMLAGMGNTQSTDWAASFSGALNRKKLLELAANWPSSESLFSLAKFCHAITWCDENLSLELVERCVPACRAALTRDPVTAFGELDDILMSVLRVFDPLEVFVGRLRPDARRLSLARRICRGIEPRRLAKQLSAIPKRDFQSASSVLLFVRRISATKFEATMAAIDWGRIERTIGHDWENMPHDQEVFIAVAYVAKRSRKEVVKVIERNAPRVKLFPPRFALMAPSAALRHVAAGGKIRFGRYERIDWVFGPATVALFAEKRPDLVDTTILPWEAEIGRALSYSHPSWYDKAADFLNVLVAVNPASLQRILGQVNVATAETGWAASLAKAGDPRRSVSLLVEAAWNRQDGVGILARTLRARFPRSSIPLDRDISNSTRQPGVRREKAAIKPV